MGGDARRVYGPGDVAERLDISGQRLRQLAAVYERVHGGLPRDRRGRVWPEEAVERLEQAHAAVADGRAASVEQALRMPENGEETSKGVEHRPVPQGPAEATLAALVEELRLLRGAVDGMSRRMAALERENRELREAVGSSSGRELESAQQSGAASPESWKTVRELLLGPRIVTSYGGRFIYAILPWYGIGCVLIWVAAAFGTYEAQTNDSPLGPVLGSITTGVSLRGIAALVFGVYAGLRDGRIVRFWVFHLTGLIAGIGAAAATRLASLWFFGQPFLEPDKIFIVSSKLVGTYLLFVSGVLLGMSLQIWAGADRRTQRASSVRASDQPSSVRDWGAKETALVGLAGSLLGALIGFAGQLVSA